MIYKYEMHAHCSECSGCASSTAEEMMRVIYDAGYAGMVMTDHSHFLHAAVVNGLSWEQEARRYYDVYLRTKETASRFDFDVLFGLEFSFGDGKDALTYGIDLDFLLQNPSLTSMGLAQYTKAVHAYGGYVVQAHPYRNRPYINMDVQPIPDLLDGVEVYNAANNPGENAKAMLLAQAHGLGLVSGADTHHTNANIGRAGMAFEHRIRTNKDLIAALRAREGKLIADGIIVEAMDDFLRAKP